MKRLQDTVDVQLLYILFQEPTINYYHASLDN